MTSIISKKQIGKGANIITNKEKYINAFIEALEIDALTGRRITVSGN